MQNLFFLR